MKPRKYILFAFIILGAILAPLDNLKAKEDISEVLTLIQEIIDRQSELANRNDELRSLEARSIVQELEMLNNSYQWKQLELEKKSVTHYEHRTNIKLEFDTPTDEPIDYDYQAIARLICDKEGYMTTQYLDLGVPAIGCGIRAKGRTSMTVEEAFAITVAESKRLTTLIKNTYSRSFTQKQMMGLVSYTYNTPQTQPALRNKRFIKAIEENNESVVREHMMTYNAFLRGLKIRREIELDMIFNE